MTPQHPRTPATAATPGPRTAAGRALLEALRVAGHIGDDWPWRILAIEAEMIPLVVREVPREKWEAQARPAVASEGLLRATENARDIALRYGLEVTAQRDTAMAALLGLITAIDADDGGIKSFRSRQAALEQARAALASDAGSVGALDVERLARAIRKVSDSDPATWLDKGDEADAIAAAYDAERQGDAPAGSEPDTLAVTEGDQD